MNPSLGVISQNDDAPVGTSGRGVERQKNQTLVDRNSSITGNISRLFGGAFNPATAPPREPDAPEVPPDIAFLRALEDYGLVASQVKQDGKIHRTSVVGRKDRSGWYVYHGDGIPAGAYGDWARSDEKQTWCSKKINTLSPVELEEHNRRLWESMERAEQARREAQGKAAGTAMATWRHSAPADPSHPYLASKGIRPHGVRQQGIALIVPAHISGRLASVQYIYPDGRKRFLRGGRTAGGYCCIGDQTTRPELVICEGYATGAMLHEETGAAVYAAFHAGNLLPVARYVRGLCPTAEIIIAADNDAWTAGNPGVTKARKAAADIGAKLLVPDFTGMDTSGRPTDWNDWFALRRAAGRAST